MCFFFLANLAFHSVLQAISISLNLLTSQKPLHYLLTGREHKTTDSARVGRDVTKTGNGEWENEKWEQSQLEAQPYR